jgi:general stress protein 26
MGKTTTQSSENAGQGKDKLREMIHGIEFAMLTTCDEGHHLRSRPMATQKQDFDGSLWFFTRDDSPKTGEISADRRVNVAYADPAGHRYVSVSGTAHLVKDRSRLEELWSPAYRAWFPKGLDDPHLALIRVDAEQAEYWDSSASTMRILFGALKGLVSGKPASTAENRKIDLEKKIG